MNPPTPALLTVKLTPLMGTNTLVAPPRLVDRQLPACGLTAGGAATTPVPALVALAVPWALEAVTVTWMVEPTSASARSYEFNVAPGMSLQAVPALLQRRHWWVYAVGALLQVPSVAVRVWP